jgi:hypothetical protein
MRISIISAVGLDTASGRAEETSGKSTPCAESASWFWCSSLKSMLENEGGAEGNADPSGERTGPSEKPDEGFHRLQSSNHNDPSG